jgi:hypothetical protein
VLSTPSSKAVNGDLSGPSQTSLTDSYQRHKELPSYIYTIDDDSSDSSTLNRTGTGFMFLSSNRFRSISSNLDSSQPSDVRVDALHALGHYAPSDLLASEFWPELKKMIHEALEDPDQLLSGQSLRLYSKLFNPANGFVAKEIYTSVVDHLSSFFTGQSALRLQTDGSLCTSDSSMEHVLTAMQLLNDFMHEISNYWVRYSNRFSEEIVSCTVSFLSLALDDPCKVSPFLLLALIDPKALWFKKWMHPNYGRAEIVQCLKEKSNQVVSFVFCRRCHV